MNSKELNNISILEIIVWFIVIVSFVSIITLITNIFKPSLVLIGSFLIIVIGIFFTKRTVNFDIQRSMIMPVFILILVSLFFRVDQEQYIMGGQDEGVYVNMSKYFENYGNIFPKDNLRESLSNELKAIYDKNNIRLEKRDYVQVKGEREGSFLPGVYVKDIQNSEYVFQFYHLHPIWMAIFGDTFGENKRQFSLLFFALLSVIVIYLVVYKITNNTFYSFMGGLLLAVSPLHAYFTKFPVTEVMALTFSLAGFYFLLMYYKIFTDEGIKNNRYLMLSLLIFGAMFFIRMHGFMYIPFFYALFLLTIISNISIKKELLIYFLGIFILFALSVWYGFVYSYPYVSEMYSKSFYRALGDNGSKLILIVIAIMIIFPFLLNKIDFFKNFVIKSKEYLLKYFYVLFFIVLALGLYKIYQLGFTDKYIENSRLDLRLHIAGIPIKSFLHSSLIVLIEHVSPILFIIFLIAIKNYNRQNYYLNALILFIFGFWVYALLLQWVVPYQFYYARYLLSELIPYLFLFIIIFMTTLKYQKLVKALLIISIIYFTILTSLQLEGTESKGAYKSLNDIKRVVAKDDLLLVDRVNYPFELKTTLKYYYDLNVFSIKVDELEEVVELYHQEKKGNIYYLAQEQININKDYISKVKSINISIESSNYYRSNLPYIKYEKNSRFYNIYKIDLKKMLLNKQIIDNILYTKNGFIGTLVNFFGDSVWAKENSKISNLNFQIKNNYYLKLSTYGWNPNKAKLDILNLKLKVNGKKLEFIKYNDNNYYFKLPDNIKMIQDVEILSNTFNPKKMGMNNDSRNLGIDLKEIKLIKELQ